MRAFVAGTAIAAAIALQGCGGGSSAKDTTPRLSDPWPYPDAASIATTSLILSWGFTGGSVAPTFDVYLSTSTTPTDLVATAEYATTAMSPGLETYTTYHWKVVARDGARVLAESPVWTFLTSAGGWSPDQAPVAGGSFLAGENVLVTVSSFQMDLYEVTYELWLDVQQWGATHGYTDLPGSGTVWNGYHPVGPLNPVNHLSWYDAVKWCNARSERDGLEPVYYTDAAHTTVFRTGSGVGFITNTTTKWSANGYALPTEVEWSFAAAGGTRGHGYRYPGGPIPSDVGWLAPFAGGSTHTVGLRSGNELGIYDLGGNVFEMIWDWYDDAYPSGTSDPRGPATGTYKVVRGGCWDAPAQSMDLWARGYDADGPVYRSYGNGFRCVRR